MASRTKDDRLVFDESKIEIKIFNASNHVLCYNMNQIKNESTYTLQDLPRVNHRKYQCNFNITLSNGCFLIQTLDKKYALFASKPFNPDATGGQTHVDYQCPFEVEFINKNLLAKEFKD